VHFFFSRLAQKNAIIYTVQLWGDCNSAGPNESLSLQKQPETCRPQMSDMNARSSLFMLAEAIWAGFCVSPFRPSVTVIPRNFPVCDANYRCYRILQYYKMDVQNS